MKYRTFGRTGWKVSELGHGMWGMGAWTGSDDKESLDALHMSYCDNFRMTCHIIIFFDSIF